MAIGGETRPVLPTLRSCSEMLRLITDSVTASFQSETLANAESQTLTRGQRVVLLRAGTPAQTMPCPLVGETLYCGLAPPIPHQPMAWPRAAFSFDTSGETRKSASVRSRAGWMWVVHTLRPFLNASGPGGHSCSQL